MFCEVTRKIVQSVLRTHFYGKNKPFFQCVGHLMYSENIRKSLIFFIFSGDLGGFKWNIGCKWIYKFLNFHLFVEEATSEICSAK